ncbi:polymorphic toxin-type HINT domain-containing protein [Amycolatopsis sp. NPDC049253]|uniref:Hint domain-containing protein n=1 Tax=Amycolatopsis sp. NPDC049253 TaxID=3155274 RepID=UPI00341B7BE1
MTVSGAVQYLVPDRQGTDQLAVNSSSLATTRRQYLPFGQERGSAPSTWPGDKGYVGGTPDPTTQLENLGAREYDPAGRRPPGSRAKASSGCNSFAGATAVLMADGSSKPIDQVHIGDTITNAEPDSHNAEQHVVTAVHVTTTDKSFDDLTFSTPDGPATITSTAQHLFWDVTLHTWREADNLRVGDEVDTPDNGHVTVAATRLYAAAIITYNLTVDEVHTYYVLAGTTGVLVHNCGPEARAAAQSAPADATMSAAARFKGTDMVSTGHSGHSSRPAYFEPEIDSALADGGQVTGRGADNCAEIRACNALIAEHGADFEDQVGRSLRLSDIEFLTVRVATGDPEPACLSCQSVLVRRGVTDLSR